MTHNGLSSPSAYHYLVGDGAHTVPLYDSILFIFFFDSKEKTNQKKKLPPGICAIQTIVFRQVYSIAQIRADFFVSSFDNDFIGYKKPNIKKRIRCEKYI